VVDLIAAERALLGALIEEQCRRLIDWVEADQKNDLVEWNHERSKRLVAEVAESFDRVFDRIQAKLDRLHHRALVGASMAAADRHRQSGKSLR
jgi:hypothetical protein